MRAALLERQHAADLERRCRARRANRRPASSMRTIRPSGVEADQPRADVERGEVDHLAVGAHRDLRGAAADVDVHHPASSRIERATAPEPYAAITVSRLSPAETATSLPACAANSSPMARALLPPHRDAGEDQRAGVDLVRIDLGVGVLLGDEGAERLGVDGARRRNTASAECRIRRRSRAR